MQIGVDYKISQNYNSRDKETPAVMHTMITGLLVQGLGKGNRKGHEGLAYEMVDPGGRVEGAHTDGVEGGRIAGVEGARTDGAEGSHIQGEEGGHIGIAHDQELEHFQNQHNLVVDNL